MRLPIFFLLLVLALFTAPRACPALEDPALEALETLRRGFAGNDNFMADIRQEKKLSLMKQVLVSRGKVRFKKPDLFYMELYPPHASKLLLKGDLMTLRLVEQRTTERISLPPEQSLRKWFDYLAKPVQRLPEGVKVKAERAGKLWNLQIYPQSPGAVQQISLRFDQQGRITSIVIQERNRDRTTLSFSNFRRNVGLQDKDFQLE